MKNKDLIHFVVLIFKCFIILIVIGIFLPKIVDYSLDRLINDSKIYKNSVVVYKLVDNNYKLVYNYVLTFYLFFKT